MYAVSMQASSMHMFAFVFVFNGPTVERFQPFLPLLVTSAFSSLLNRDYLFAFNFRFMFTHSDTPTGMEWLCVCSGGRAKVVVVAGTHSSIKFHFRNTYTDAN